MKKIPGIKKSVASKIEFAKEIFSKGIQAIRQKKYIQALDHFSNCIRLEFRIVDSHFYLGRIRYEISDYAGAVFDYSIVLEAQPENAGAYNNRAIARVALADFENALDDYNKAIELDLKDYVYYSNRGLVWLNIDSPNNALADFNRAIDLEPTYAKAYLFRGNVWQRFYNFHSAINDYTKAIENSPQFYEAYLKRGKINLYFGDIEYGMNNLQYGAEFISYAFWHKENIRGEGLFRDYPFYYDRAISDFTKAIEIRPKDYNGYINRAIANLRISLYYGIKSPIHKLHRRAEHDALQAVKLSGGEAGLYALASAEARLGKIELSMVHLEQALDYGEESIDAVFNDKSWENMLDNLTFSAIIENYKAEEGLFDDFGF